MARNNMRLHIPPELTDTIIDFLHDDVQSLLACALVSHSWLPCSRLHLFQSCTIRDPGQFEVAFRTILTTVDVSKYVLNLTIVGERIHPFTFKILNALLANLPQLRRLSLQKVTFHTSPFIDYQDVPVGHPAAASLELELAIPRRPQRSGPFALEELQILECDATMDKYAHLFRVLGLFSSVETLFIASSSGARKVYSFHHPPDWRPDPVHVAVQHLHTFDIPFPIIDILLNTLARANTLRTFWYDDNVLDGLSSYSEKEKFGKMVASLPAHQQLRCVILGPLPIFQRSPGESSLAARAPHRVCMQHPRARAHARDFTEFQEDLQAMQLASMRGLRAFHLRGHVLEPHIADVFAALPDSVREARFIVVGVSRAYAEGFLNSFHEFARAFKDELTRRAGMTFVLDLGFARRRLSEERFASLSKRADRDLWKLRLAAPGRVRIDER